MSSVVPGPEGGLVLGQDVRDLRPIVDVGTVSLKRLKLWHSEPKRLAMADDDGCMEVIPKERVQVIPGVVLGTSSRCDVNQRRGLRLMRPRLIRFTRSRNRCVISERDALSEWSVSV